MQNSERVYFLKQKRMYAARVINQVARFNYMMNHHENFEEEAVKKVIKMIKFNLTKFKSAQRLFIIRKKRFLLKNSFKEIWICISIN